MEEPLVLLMPFPAQGHIKPMLCLAQLLCHAGIHVTFLNTEHIHLQFTNRHAISAHFPSLRFESIPDGLPENHPRIRQNNPELIVSLTSVTKPLFKQLLVSSLEETTTAGGGSNVINCVIADCVLPFAIDVAQELGIPVIEFRTTSACYLWTTSFCIPKLLEEGQLPFKDNDDLDQPVTGVVGTEGVVPSTGLTGLLQGAT
ncbi:Glycosyltransferase [Quillaja saponaria]|uniref:Glycosyltransferase n=1 Tax=Quillaja saponaria TaxID=32244 RepID=A0AAD7PN53_QUISA|nr:Glycosyltransferase [Quillaja saponaria]